MVCELSFLTDWNQSWAWLLCWLVLFGGIRHGVYCAVIPTPIMVLASAKHHFVGSLVQLWVLWPLGFLLAMGPGMAWVSE